MIRYIFAYYQSSRWKSRQINIFSFLRKKQQHFVSFCISKFLVITVQLLSDLYMYSDAHAVRQVPFLVKTPILP